MPDWFYRTVAQPVLFLLPQPAGRHLALGVIGSLGQFSAGRALIDFLGHMGPDPRLTVRVGGIDLASPIGLGWRVDPDRKASGGLARFGVGCIELLVDESRAVTRKNGNMLADGAAASPIRAALPDISQPWLRRRKLANGSEYLEWPSGAFLPVVGWEELPSAEMAATRAGVVLQSGTRQPNGGWCVPAAMPKQLPERVRAWRNWLQKDAPLVVSGGVACPDDALALLDAGASLILLDAGLVFHGPGLVKRCNEALLGREHHQTKPTDLKPSLFRQAWFWALALGGALVAGGLATLVLALTRVLLPYDESFLGLTAETLRRNSPRLFAFMAHDRGTLAGTMLGLGWLYCVLACRGVRQGADGARTSLVASALTGFASFFAFFGFGYFDTLHAFVAAVLFQFTVQIMVGEADMRATGMTPADREDAAWRRAQWGQLLWVTHAAGLLVAGGIILWIGMTSVFVGEDLEYLCITPEQAKELGVKLIGVVAHDRATLGGMLLASGVAMLLPVLWCCRRGAAWLWWALAGLGIPAYAAALGVHFRAGYVDWRHLVPAFAGLFLWAGGLALTGKYLLTKPAPSATRS